MEFYLEDDLSNDKKMKKSTKERSSKGRKKNSISLIREKNVSKRRCKIRCSSRKIFLGDCDCVIENVIKAEKDELKMFKSRNRDSSPFLENEADKNCLEEKIKNIIMSLEDETDEIESIRINNVLNISGIGSIETEQKSYGKILLTGILAEYKSKSTENSISKDQKEFPSLKTEKTCKETKNDTKSEFSKLQNVNDFGIKEFSIRIEQLRWSYKKIKMYDSIDLRKFLNKNKCEKIKILSSVSNFPKIIEKSKQKLDKSKKTVTKVSKIKLSSKTSKPCSKKQPQLKNKKSLLPTIPTTNATVMPTFMPQPQKSILVQNKKNTRNHKVSFCSSIFIRRFIRESWEYDSS